MVASAAAHLIFRILNAPLRATPFPHFYCDEVFPPAVFADIRAHLPPANQYQAIADTGRLKRRRGAPAPYRDRYVITLTSGHIERFDPRIRPFWKSLTAALASADFGGAVLSKFQPHLSQRFAQGAAPDEYVTDIQLIRDRRGHGLGPHTDHPNKVAVVLFYLPADTLRPGLGTSIYVPKDRRFTCAGGPHHRFEDFDRVFTAPYVPNAAFGFFKTANSFHGVEPVTDGDAVRDVIQLSIGIP